MRPLLLFVGVVVAATACSSRDRDAPMGGTGPTSGVTATTTTTSGGGGMIAPVTCDDEGVTCETQTYEADCSAFPGKAPVWTFLSFDTTIVGDARVEFSVRAADTEAELAQATYELAGVGDADRDDVPPSAPIFLDEVLSGADVVRPWLELQIQRVASGVGDTPGVEGWDLNFTCQDF